MLCVWVCSSSAWGLILGVLTLGLLNRLLIQDIQLPAVLAAMAVAGQQLMGFTRAWFGHRSDRIPPSRLRRTPFIVISSLAIALFPVVRGGLPAGAALGHQHGGLWR